MAMARASASDGAAVCAVAGGAAARNPRRVTDSSIAIRFMIYSFFELHIEIQYDLSRYRRVARGARRVGSGGSSSARTNASRLFEPCAEFFCFAYAGRGCRL